jgi:cell division transport system permease protein
MKKRTIMPASNGTAPLDVVIAVMAFLAALALGASLIAERAADSWSQGLAAKLTVQILPPSSGPAKAALAAETAAALQVLRATPGIARAAPLSEQEQLKLVQPWINADMLVADLPLPQLIDADVAPGADIDSPALAARLKAVAPHSVLDDHSHWIARLRDMAETLAWSAYGVLFLIAVATAATVAFATRAGLDAHNDMVSLLHQMGAQAGFIAGAFQSYYQRAALIAAGTGAGLAAVLFLVTGGLQATGVGLVPFLPLPPMSLRGLELLWLLAVPVAAGAIAAVTARLSVLSALRRIY